MIAYLEGNLMEKSPEHAIVNIAGIGYKIEIPLTTFYNLPQAGSKVELHIFTVVREDSIRLFGFQSDQERKLFELFLSISRIGPKLALNILSGMELEPLKKAIMMHDCAALATIPGMGKKTAERLLFELKEKKEKLAAAIDVERISSKQEPFKELNKAISVLTNLGYNQSIAKSASSRAIEQEGENASIQIIIRRALKNIKEK